MKSLSSKFPFLAAILASLLVSAMVYAGSAAGTSLIGNITLRDAGVFVRRFDGQDWANQDNCARSSLLKLDNANMRFEMMYSTLLTAQTSGKEVNIYTVGCGSTPYSSLPNVPVITEITILP